jgi:multiple sugar transport system ATP-binding protein
MNMLEARVERADGRLVAVAGTSSIVLDQHPFLESWVGRAIVLGIRPENLEDAELAPADHSRLQGRVQLREALGAELLVHFTTSARQAMTDEMRELAEDMGADRPRGGENAVLVGRFHPRSRVNAGDQIEVAVDPVSLHFFDPETGLAIR